MTGSEDILVFNGDDNHKVWAGKQFMVSSGFKIFN